MKAQRHFTRGEPKRVGNVVIIASMLLSLLFLSLIKSRYCASPSHGVFLLSLVSLFLFSLFYHLFFNTDLGLNWQ